jgi:hypothetical protein
MKKISLNTAENQDYWMEKDILSAYRQQTEKSNHIQQGMSPLEIADIVSDRLIDLVKAQFDSVKAEYLSKNK